MEGFVVVGGGEFEAWGAEAEFSCVKKCAAGTSERVEYKFSRAAVLAEHCAQERLFFWWDGCSVDLSGSR